MEPRTRRTLASVLLVWAIVPTAFPTPASAQTVFVEGTLFAGIERRSDVQFALPALSNPGLSTLIPVEPARLEPNGTVLGGTATVGAWLNPKVSIRLEVGWPAALNRRLEQNFPVPAIASLPRYDYSFSHETWDRARTFSTLIAYHTQRRHGIQLAYLGGAAFVWQTHRTRFESVYPVFTTGGTPPFGPGNPPIVISTPYREVNDFTNTEYKLTGAVGLDADLALSSHLSAVPQIRVLGVSGGLSVRPGVGLRLRW